MRIVKIHNYYLRSGGEDTVFENEIALLRSRGHHVIKYVESNERIDSMSKISVALQTIWSYSSYEKLKRFLTATRPDVAHFHNTFPLISPSAYYVCQELGIPVIQTLDNQRLICPAASFYRDGKLCIDCLGKTPPWPGVIHRCYHDSRMHTAVVASMLTIHRWLRTWKTKVDAFLCSTKFYRDLFAQSGLPAEKIVVVPHFVEQQIQSDITQTGDYALFVGRLDPEKGVRTLLEAWRNVNIPLKIRGHGRLEHEAIDFVQRHHLDSVEFVGRLEKSDLSNLRRNARFLVVPSEGYYETFGMVIIESFAQGTPVVASNVGVLPEIVVDKHNGLLFEAGNPFDLAEKVSWMWKHPDESRAMGSNGLKDYKEKYTPEQFYKTLEGVYERLLDKK